MSGEIILTELIKNMTPILHEGDYVFLTVKDIMTLKGAQTICEFKEDEGITVIIEKSNADKLNLKYDFIASWITLSVHSSLDAIGFTAAFANELAKNNISCNVISGYYHDHIFVNKKDCDEAMRTLEQLSKKT